MDDVWGIGCRYGDIVIELLNFYIKINFTWFWTFLLDSTPIFTWILQMENIEEEDKID